MPGAGGCREGGGRDLRRATWGQRPGEGWLSNIGDWHPGGARGRSPRFRPLTSAVSSLGPGVMRGAWAWGQRSKVRAQSRETGHRGPKPEPSPLRRAPSSSGFLVTDTTFMTRRFPPWRIDQSVLLRVCANKQPFPRVQTLSCAEVVHLQPDLSSGLQILLRDSFSLTTL